MTETHVVQRTTIDSRRLLRPCDYATDPFSFGTRRTGFAVPVGGDNTSCEIAALIHDLVIAVRSKSVVSGAAIGRRYGFSRQTWSSITRGQRWPGHTVLAALIGELRDTSNTDTAT